VGKYPQQDDKAQEREKRRPFGGLSTDGEETIQISKRRLFFTLGEKGLGRLGLRG